MRFAEVRLQSLDKTGFKHRSGRRQRGVAICGPAFTQPLLVSLNEPGPTLALGLEDDGDGGGQGFRPSRRRAPSGWTMRSFGPGGRTIETTKRFRRAPLWNCVRGGRIGGRGCQWTAKARPMTMGIASKAKTMIALRILAPNRENVVPPKAAVQGPDQQFLWRLRHMQKKPPPPEESEGLNASWAWVQLSKIVGQLSVGGD